MEITIDVPVPLLVGVTLLFVLLLFGEVFWQIYLARQSHRPRTAPKEAREPARRVRASIPVSEDVATAHRRTSVWFMALIAAILVAWWKHPFALVDLLWIAGLLVGIRFCAYIICTYYPRMAWLVMVVSGGVVGVLLLLEVFNHVVS